MEVTRRTCSVTAAGGALLLGLSCPACSDWPHAAVAVRAAATAVARLRLDTPARMGIRTRASAALRAALAAIPGTLRTRVLY